ncbi:MAG TPA: metal ABC transporter substrate-binding protein [Nitrospiria bacterium]
MKKSVVLFILIFLMKGLVWGASLKVVTTTEDLAAIAREVGGNLVTVESITHGAQDPHFLEARPSQMLKASKADLFIQIGLDLEVGWVPPLLVGARNPKIQPGASGYLDTSNAITPLEVMTVPVDRSRGDVHPFGNPHYWLDPENGKMISKTISQRMSQMIPEQAMTFQKNQKNFEIHLNEAISKWKEKLKPYQGTKIVTYHNSWSYFAKRFGLDVVAFVEPKPGIPPSPVHVNSLIPLMKTENVKLIIMEPYFNRSIPNLLARETGATVVVLPPSVGGEKGVKTYKDLFDHLVGKITTSLSKGS